MNLRKYTKAVMALLLGGVIMSSCNDKDVFAPKSGNTEALGINEVGYFSDPGVIKVTWKRDAATEGKDLLYVEGKYYDPYLHKEVIRLASENADTLVMPKTFKAAGVYTVSLTPVSSDGNRGATTTIEVQSEAVESEVTFDPDKEPTKIPLTIDMLSTNAQEPTEGPIAGLIDGNNTTFFHSAWSVKIAELHYLQVALKEPIGALKIEFVTRHNGDGAGDVSKMKVYVSNDAKEWTEAFTESYDLSAIKRSATISGGQHILGSEGFNRNWSLGGNI